MRDHDLELIAALVEGRLEDETEARALIASSAEAREEYEAQRLAYESLRALSTANLTENERTILHRDVWTELRTETATRGTKTPWYYRWAAVAASLFVVIGLLAVLSGQQGGDSLEETAAELSDDGEAGAAPTTTAAGAADMDSGGDDARAESAPTETTGAASEGTTMANEAADENASFYEAEATRVRQREFTAYLQAFEENEDGDVDACLDQAGLIDYYPVATLDDPDRVAGDGEESLVVAAPEQTVLTEAPLAFVDVDTCQLIYVAAAPR